MSTREGDPPSTVRLPSGGRTDLFLISFLLLFLELVFIRWLPAHVLYLTFFTNTALLASFLGMSLGCLLASSPRPLIRTTPWLLALTTGTALLFEAKRHRLRKLVRVGDSASPQVVFFGAEGADTAELSIGLPVELVAGGFFLLIALTMLGPGQLLGRYLGREEDRIAAYSLNIGGSLAGIAAFTLCSYLELSPLLWFSLVVALLAYFRRSGSGGAWIAPLTLILLALAWTNADTRTHWSPYYRVDYRPGERTIAVNLIGHQTMVPIQHPAPAYAIPYLLNRDADRPSFQDVLIIGAGSGNDVARALQWGARRVDAVEIDPVIQRIGRADHPDRPYADPRVHAVVDDGRNFLRRSQQRYDLIVYALVDSLVLHSSYSNLRLESYLFTREAMQDVRRLLKPDGTFAMYNFYRQGWIVGRLSRGVEEVFGESPLVLTLPRQERLGPDSQGGFTVLLAGNTEPIAKRFADEGAYWIPDAPPTPDIGSAFGSSRVASGGTTLAPAKVEIPDDVGPATDDWPFLYVRRPMLPSLSLRGILVMGGLGLGLLWASLPRGSWRKLDLRMFFLGAGFMLIETGAVVQMALLFGSTWMVNSLVFIGILGMILLANLGVARLRPRRLWPAYCLLVLALGLRFAVPLSSLLGLGRPSQIAAAILQAFLPILFAGVVFAICFARSDRPELDFGSNIAGAMFGGLLEYASLLTGFAGLTVVAMVAYVLSAIVSPRSR